MIFVIIYCIPVFINASSYKVSKPKRIAGGDGMVFMRPLWSPDGSRIAFTEANYHGLWIIKPDGSDIKQISDEPAAGFGFEWSSDSKAIVSRVAKFEGRYRYNAVRLFDLANDKTRLITDYRTFMPGLPHWSDGDSKIFLFGRGKMEIFQTGKKISSLKKNHSTQNMIFLKNDLIAVGNINSKQYNVYEPVKDQRYINLVISPDGSMIGFEVIGGNLYVMNVDGSNVIDLGRGHRPQWAPDNQHLVFMITEDDGYRYLSSDIYTIKIDGSEKKKLTDTDVELEMNPCWSPDGNSIVFDVMEEGAIYLIKLTEKKNGLRKER